MAHDKPSNYSAMRNVGFNINGPNLFEPTNQNPDICHTNYTNQYFLKYKSQLKTYGLHLYTIVIHNRQSNPRVTQCLMHKDINNQ